MEDVDTLISRALKLIDEWEEEPKTRHTADQLQMTLTLLKVAIGIDRFNELPSFVRYLDETTCFIRNDAKKHIQQIEQRFKLDEAFEKVEDEVIKLERKVCK